MVKSADCTLRKEMEPENIRNRTKRFSGQIVCFVRSLPKGEVGRMFSRQLFRSGTSVGANMRAAVRAKSTADMISKLKTVEEELDETQYWLELIEEDGIESAATRPLIREADELLAIVVASIKSLRRKQAGASAD